MNSKNVSFANIMKFAGAYVACAIGSGFATGQEILQFFAGQGIMSIAGTVVTTIVFSWVGAMFMKHGYEHQLESPCEILEFYFGKKFGKYVEIAFQLVLYGVYVIMIAGAGSTLAEYFGLNPMIGRIGMAVLAFFTVIMGLTKLTDILGSLGNVIIIFALGIGIFSFISSMGSLGVEASKVADLDIIKTGGGWLWSSILYPGFNAIVVLIITCSMGKTSRNVKEATLGGLIGGILFGLAICAMNLGILSNISELYDKAVPTLALAQNISGIVAVIFSVIICCGIYTTTVPMLWGTARHFAEDRSRKMVIVALVLTVAGLLLGMTDFKVLVNIIYPFSGYMGIALFFAVAVCEYKDKRKEYGSNARKYDILETNN